MELLIVFLFLTGLYLILFITRPLFTLLHELGHALAYLILTKPDKIDVFIGSYDDIDPNIKFKILKLNFYIKISFPFIKPGGGCRSHKTETNYLKSMIITLAGPLFALLLICTIASIILGSNANNLIKIYWLCLMMYTIISFYVNVRPKKNILPGINNDGYTLLFKFRIRTVFSEYILADTDMMAGRYDAAANRFLNLIVAFPKEEIFLRHLTDCLICTKRFTEAEKYLLNLYRYHQFTTTDHLSLGYLQSLSDQHDLAVQNYRDALTNEPENLVGLNNLGYELTLKGNVNESRGLLEKAMNIDPNFAYTYSNLGYVSLLEGDAEKGKTLIERSLELEPTNAYGYKHLAIYYLKMMNKDLAILNIAKAIELDPTVKLEDNLKDLLPGQ